MHFQNNAPLKENELSQLSIQRLMNSLPKFELSYETVAHKKVSTDYDISLAVPMGKKYIGCFSTDYTNDAYAKHFYIMELNKDKKVIHVYEEPYVYDTKLARGTIIYGTIMPCDGNEHGRRYFVVEDMIHHNGLNLSKMSFGLKLGHIEEFLEKQTSQVFTSNNSIAFCLPSMWCKDTGYSVTDDVIVDFEKRKNEVGYSVHHVQIRKLLEISPYLNVGLMMNRPSQFVPSGLNALKSAKPETTSKLIPGNKLDSDFKKMQYKYPTIFQVVADIQFDVYHLYAFGNNKCPVYVDVACIPNIKTSIFMNDTFRKIRENQNLDYIEESDDEEDFQNMNEAKYVDLDKIVHMECVFNHKFKRWVPFRICDRNAKIIHVSRL